LENVGERDHPSPGSRRVPLAKEEGVLVFRAGQPLAASVTDDLLEQIRESATGRIWPPRMNFDAELHDVLQFQTRNWQKMAGILAIRLLF